MEIYKIAAIGIISVIIVVYLKSINSELAIVASVASGILILVLSFSYIKQFVSFFSELTESGGVDKSLFYISLKIIAISYIIEFSSGVANDFGQASLGEKIRFAGKAIMITLAIPLIKNMLETVIGLL